MESRRDREATGSGAVSGVILAAGASTRFAGPLPKQLLPFDGEPLVRRISRQALAASLGEVVVVLGHRAEEIARAVVDLPLKTVVNPGFANGQSTSVRCGLQAIDRAATGVLFLPVDQPYLSTETLQRLLGAFDPQHPSIVVPVCRGSDGQSRRGAPALFHQAYFCHLARIRGDSGGRQLLHRFADALVEVDLDDPLALADVDTAEDLDRLRKGRGL